MKISCKRVFVIESVKNFPLFVGGWAPSRYKTNKTIATMTLFLVMLLTAAASPHKNKPLKDKYHTHYGDALDTSVLSPLLDRKPPETSSQPTSCATQFYDEMNLDILKNSVITLMKNGIKGKDILGDVIKTVKDYPIKSYNDIPYKKPTSKEFPHTDIILPNLLKPQIPRERYHTRSHGPASSYGRHIPPFLNKIEQAPPSVMLEIQGMYPSDSYQIKIDMMPFMGVNDILQQAYLEYSYRFPDANNPFEIEIVHFKSSNCYQVATVANEIPDKGYHWKIQVFNNKIKMEYEGRCIPSSNKVTLTPGDVVRLVYSKSVMESTI